MEIIEARTGTAFKLKKGEYLTVTDIEGEQVSDMLAYNIEDIREVISSGRSLDYAENIGCIVHQDPTKIFDVECEIFAPCAMGGALNSDTIPRLRTKIVAGCANNQLENQQSGIDLRERGILYIPDFVINAGGVINLSFEMGRTYSESHAMERVAKIYDSVNSILALSDENGAPPVQAAESLAEERIRLARLAE